MDVPDVPEDVTASMLDRDARARLRTLSKDNAEDVGRHLVMAGRMVDDDPELAYRHAQVALARGGRVDIVREAAALTAYATGRYAEALREFRTVTRLNGHHDHLALVADCERGLGRPAKALEVAASPEVARLSAQAQVELRIVVAGARVDLGEVDVALLILERLKGVDDAQQRRIDAVRDSVRALRGSPPDPHTGQEALADDATSAPADATEDWLVSDDFDDDIIVYDLADDDEAVSVTGDELPDDALDDVSGDVLSNVPSDTAPVDTQE